MLSRALLVSLGSIAGGLARFYLTGFFLKKFGPSFPLGTLTANILGCFLIGIFLTLGEHQIPLGAEGKLLLMTGFCGAFTTFSTFMLETNDLMGEGMIKAFLYAALSLVLGFAAFRAGIYLVKP